MTAMTHHMPLAGDFSMTAPQGEEGEETYAYSLEEVTQMLAVLPEPAATVVAAAAFTGMRRGELRGIALGELQRDGNPGYAIGLGEYRHRA